MKKWMKAAAGALALSLFLFPYSSGSMAQGADPANPYDQTGDGTLDQKDVSALLKVGAGGTKGDPASVVAYRGDAAQAAELIGGVSEDFRRNLALSAYGRYTEQQLEEMRNHLSEDDIKSLGKPIGAKRQKQKSDSGIGFWGHLFAITAAICKASRRKR